MKKNIVKINESALKGLIAKSVRKALKEGIGDEAVRGLFGKTPDEGMGTFSEIDNALQERGIDAYVSKFFSDEGRVMVMVKSHENDEEIKDILSQFGYGECIGQGIDWIQFTKGESAVNESKTDKDMKKSIVKINENTLKQIIAESVKKILNEDGGYYNNDIDFGDSPSQQTHLIEPMKLLVDGYKNYISDWNMDGSDISFGKYCEMLREKFEL